MTDTATLAPIGHNSPPEPDPFDVLSARADDLYLETGNFADGAEIQNELPAGSGEMVVRHVIAGEVRSEGQDQQEAIVVAAPQDVLEDVLAIIDASVF